MVTMRYMVLAGAAVLGLLVLGEGGWLLLRHESPPAAAEFAAQPMPSPQNAMPPLSGQPAATAATPPAGSAETGPLPVPPVPPRIAEGDDYEHCLSMLGSDPAGANVFAEAWSATGGGDGATHCQALAQVALGNPESGASMMQKLATDSHAPDAARAIVFGQSGQAWLMAGDPSRAYAAESLALGLSPDDPDLLIDRSVAAATLERYQDAVSDLDRALEIDQKRADALVFRGAAWRHLDRLDRAQNDIDHALLLDPDNADALLERGILRQRQNNAAGARADWQRAIELAPDTATSDLAEQNLALLEAGPDRH